MRPTSPSSSNPHPHSHPHTFLPFASSSSSFSNKPKVSLPKDAPRSRFPSTFLPASRDSMQDNYLTSSASALPSHLLSQQLHSSSIHSSSSIGAAGVSISSWAGEGVQPQSGPPSSSINRMMYPTNPNGPGSTGTTRSGSGRRRDRPKVRLKDQPDDDNDEENRRSIDKTESDLHAIEQKMLDDIGLFRHQKPNLTVESLLREKQLQRQQQQQQQQQRQQPSLSNSESSNAAAFTSHAPLSSYTSAIRIPSAAVASSSSSSDTYITPSVYSSALISSSSLSSSDRSPFATGGSSIRHKNSISGIGRPSTSHHHENNDDEDGSSVSDFSLITTLTSRLSTLEKIASKQAKIIGAKDTLIQQQAQKISALTLAASAPQSPPQLQQEEPLRGGLAAAEEIVRLNQQVERFQRQCREMESFLKDYGLVWIGFRAEENSSEKNGEEKGKDDTESGEPDEGAADITSEAVDGSPQQAASTLSPSPSPSSPSPLSGTPEREIYFSMATILSSVNELNSLVPSSSSSTSLPIQTNSRGSGITASFSPYSTGDSFPIIFYRDGIWLYEGPLRSYADPKCEEFVQDLLDGYFPYELKEKYPDGVRLAVIDRSQMYRDEKKETERKMGLKNRPGFVPFQGRGNRLDGGSPDEQQSVTTEMKRASTASLDQRRRSLYANLSSKSPQLSPSPTSPSPISSPPPLNSSSSSSAASSSSSMIVPPSSSSALPPFISAADYLARLPMSVISNGRIVPVRSEIAGLLMRKEAKRLSTTVNKSNTVVVETPVLKELREKIEARVIPAAGSTETVGRSRPTTPRDICVLQIKLEPPLPTVLMKLRHTDTIAMLKGLIQRERKVGLSNWKEKARMKMERMQQQSAKESGIEAAREAWTRAVEADEALGDFELRSSYPSRVFHDETETLLQAGLVPNASLFVRPIASPTHTN